MEGEEKEIGVGDYVVFLGNNTRGIVIGLEGIMYVISVPKNRLDDPSTIKASAAEIKRAP